MLRLSRLSYIWMLAAPLWAPVAWLIPYVIYIDELLSGLGGNFFIRGQLLLPSLMLWTAAVIIHLSLWTLARRIYILAIPPGPPDHRSAVGHHRVCRVARHDLRP